MKGWRATFTLIKQPGFIGKSKSCLFFSIPPKRWKLRRNEQILNSTFNKSRSQWHTNLQQASGSREAQCERLTADVEGLRVGLLWANRKWVWGSSGDPPTGQPEQGVRAECQGRIRRVVKMEHGETQRRQTNHECCLDRRNEECLDIKPMKAFSHTHTNTHNKLVFDTAVLIFLVNFNVLTIRRS